LANKEREVVREICNEYLGKEYDYIQILGYVMRYFFKMDIKMFNNPNMLICSEAVGDILYEFGLHDEELPDMTPNELFSFLISLQKNKKQIQ
jgi:hypothetical protein